MHDAMILVQIHDVSWNEKADRGPLILRMDPASFVDAMGADAEPLLETRQRSIALRRSEAEKAFVGLVVYTEILTLHFSSSFHEHFTGLARVAIPRRSIGAGYRNMERVG